MPPPQPDSEGQQQFGEHRGTACTSQSQNAIFFPQNGKGGRDVCYGDQDKGCCRLQAGTDMK